MEACDAHEQEGGGDVMPEVLKRYDDFVARVKTVEE